MDDRFGGRDRRGRRVEGEGERVGMDIATASKASVEGGGIGRRVLEKG